MQAVPVKGNPQEIGGCICSACDIASLYFAVGPYRICGGNLPGQYEVPDRIPIGKLFTDRYVHNVILLLLQQLLDR